jgi:phage shock protein A
MKKFALIAVLLAQSAACGGVAFAGDDQIGHCPAPIAARPVAVVSNVEKAPDFIDLASQTLKTMGDEHRQLTAAVKRLNDDAANVDGKLHKLYADAQGIAASLRALHAGVSTNCYPFCVDGTSVANRCVAERLTSTLLARSRAIHSSIHVLEKQLSAGHHETARMVGSIDTLESRMALVPYQTSRIAAQTLPQASGPMLETLQAMLPQESPEIQELRIRVAEFLAAPLPESQTAEGTSESTSAVQ